MGSVEQDVFGAVAETGAEPDARLDPCQNRLVREAPLGHQLHAMRHEIVGHPRDTVLGLDQHTLKGKAMGRGLDHFRKDSAKPPPTAPARTRLMPLAIKQR